VERYRPTKDLAEAVAWFAELLWGHAPQQAISALTTALKNVPEERRLMSAVALLLARPESQLM
jgi:hypothetical protein